MKIIIVALVSFLSISCQEGLIFNPGIKLLELESKTKPFEVAVARRSYGNYSNGLNTYLTSTNDYYDSSRLGERCLYPLKSENLFIKIDNNGNVISSLPRPSSVPYDLRLFNNKPCSLSENYGSNLGVLVKMFNEDLEETQSYNFSLAPFVKNGYTGYTRAHIEFQSEKQFVLSGNLVRNTTNEQVFFIATVNENKVLKYYQSPDVPQESLSLINGLFVNQNEVLFLGLSSSNTSSKYHLYRYNLIQNTLTDEIILPFVAEAESYLGIQKITATSVVFIPNGNYSNSPTFKNWNIHIYDFSKKELAIKPLEIDKNSTKAINIIGYQVFNEQVLLDINTIDGNFFAALKDDGTCQTIFKRQTNYGRAFFFKNQTGATEMIEIGDIPLPKNRMKTVFFKHSGLDKVFSKTLFEGVTYYYNCFH